MSRPRATAGGRGPRRAGADFSRVDLARRDVSTARRRPRRRAARRLPDPDLAGLGVATTLRHQAALDLVRPRGRARAGAVRRFSARRPSSVATGRACRHDGPWARAGELVVRDAGDRPRSASPVASPHRGIVGVAFSPDGTASSPPDTAPARLWDVGRRARVRQIGPGDTAGLIRTWRSAPTAAGSSPGTALRPATAQVTRLWDAATGGPLGVTRSRIGRRESGQRGASAPTAAASPPPAATARSRSGTPPPARRVRDAARAHGSGLRRGLQPRRPPPRLGQRRPDGHGSGTPPPARRSLDARRGHTGTVYGRGVQPRRPPHRLGQRGPDGEGLGRRPPGRKSLTLAGHTDPVIGVAFSPDGRRIASGRRRPDGQALGRRPPGQEVAHARAGHSHGAGRTAWRSAPTAAASPPPAADRTVKALGRRPPGEELLTLTGHTGGVDAAWRSAPTAGASPRPADDRTVKVWDAGHGPGGAHAHGTHRLRSAAWRSAPTADASPRPAATAR